MPTYEYACEKCGHNFDVFQSMKDKPLRTCPKDRCQLRRWGRGKVKRQLGTGAGLIFKGSGFYITDYRSEGYKSAAKKESESAKSATTSDSKSSDAATKSGGSVKTSAPATPKKT